MKLFEVLDKPLPFHFEQQPSLFHDTKAIFKLPVKDNIEIEYIVGFEPLEDGVFLIAFTQRKTNLSSYDIKSSYNITNTGEQYKVFSTIKDIIKKFAEAIENNFGIFKGFVFSAREPSRVKLYDRFISLFSKEGFKYNHKDIIGKETYYAVAKKPEYLKDIIKYI